MIPSNTMGNSRWLILISTAVLLCFSAYSVNARHIHLLDFDLEASAAEPRPIFIETGPSAEALPLVAAEPPDSASGPLSDASEKVEKVLRPAMAFSYNQKETEDGDTAESKYGEDQKPAAVDYYKYVEAEEKKEGAGKGVVVVEAGGESAESKHHGHKHKDNKGGSDQGGEFEKGGGKEFHAHHDGEHGEKGDKGYKGHHHHEKGQKGHHDHEGHDKAYEEKGGHAKDHHHKDGYHGEHQKSHNGKKGAKYAEKGEHNKGHSTRGSHSVHKKDEYEKKTEFFDEDHEGGESEKHGGFSHSDSYKKGGHHKGGHHKGGEHKEHHGKEQEASKGGHYKDEQGHHENGGHEVHHDHDTKYGKKESDSSGKKWAYREGDGKDGGGGGGGGDGGGAHSHQSYAVQAPPKQQQQVAEASAVNAYDFPPISAFILPLEGELVKLGNERRGNINDGRVESSEHVRSIAKKGQSFKKRRPTPTDDFLADNPYSKSSETRPSSTTTSPIELLIRQSLISNLENTAEEKPNPQPAAPTKMIKKRRLRKRKIQKGTKGTKTAAETSRASRAVPDCPLGHKKELHIPGESSHNFVIVAADDSL